MKINFENIAIKEGYIKADYNDDENSHYIEFKLSTPIKVREDLIALSLATLCGKKYVEITLELNITNRIKMAIERFTGATVICKTDFSSPIISKSFGNQTVNFSGGFDSMAALPFLPKNSSLVSMDFGGHFSREMKMINKFDSYIVKTNILETNFRRNSWLFMVIGSILYKDLIISH